MNLLFCLHEFCVSHHGFGGMNDDTSTSHYQKVARNKVERISSRWGCRMRHHAYNIIICCQMTYLLYGSHSRSDRDVLRARPKCVTSREFSRPRDSHFRSHLRLLHFMTTKFLAVSANGRRPFLPDL